MTASPFSAPRLPPLPDDRLDDAQRAATAALVAGPRKAVKGPFIALMRSPELLDRVQRVGEFLRFRTVLPVHASEWATLVVARRLAQSFEWAVHVPLARAAGVPEAAIEALRTGRRPADLDDELALVHDFTAELLADHRASDARYAAALARYGERGVVELVSLVGYFVMMSLVLNVAQTPPDPDATVAAMAG